MSDVIFNVYAWAKIIKEQCAYCGSDVDDILFGYYQACHTVEHYYCEYKKYIPYTLYQVNTPRYKYFVEILVDKREGCVAICDVIVTRYGCDGLVNIYDSTKMR